MKTLRKGKRLLNSFQEPITLNADQIKEFLSEFVEKLVKEDPSKLTGLSKATHYSS